VEAFVQGRSRREAIRSSSISPFGIWRPGNPAQIAAFDAYTEIYATRRSGLEKGWGDYFAPHSTGRSVARQQSFPCCTTGGSRRTEAPTHLAGAPLLPRLGYVGASSHGQEISNQIDTHARARRGFGTHPFQHDGADEGSRQPRRKADGPLRRTGASCPRRLGSEQPQPGKPVVSLGRSAATGEYRSRSRRRRREGWALDGNAHSPVANGRAKCSPVRLRAHRPSPFDSIDRVIVTAVSRTGVESAISTAVIRAPRRICSSYRCHPGRLRGIWSSNRCHPGRCGGIWSSNRCHPGALRGIWSSNRCHPERSEGSAAPTLFGFARLLVLAHDAQRVSRPRACECRLRCEPRFTSFERDVECLARVAPSLNAAAAVEVGADADVIDAGDFSRRGRCDSRSRRRSPTAIVARCRPSPVILGAPFRRE